MSLDLENIDWDSVDKKVKKFSLEDDIRLAKCVHVYDGDTIQVVFPLQGILYRWSCRLSGVDTPELRTKNKNEKKYGYEVRDALRKKILNKMIVLHCGEFDKYGRLLGKVYLKTDGQEGGGEEDEKEDDPSINKWLIDNEYAFAYDGGTKKNWETYLLDKANNQ